ncbi:MAG: LysM peptidoglycan-binding domain-containing protein [Candidatus Omnitrophica bacterium]|nr:LysM peptidoglycan-binding domain-containing protein [Candidatus Omnitrophota bacterium]
MKNLIKFGILSIIFVGCATNNAQKQTLKKLSSEEVIDMKLKQAISIAETALEVSKNAEKMAVDAVNTSNQAKVSADAAVKKADEAVKAANEAISYTEREVKKAIDAANKASADAIKASNEARDKAIDAANKAIDAANKASERAIAEANKASERAIGVANQTLAEVNRLRATIQTKPEEPIIEKEPEVRAERYYIVKKGDTLGKIAYKFYNDTNKWQLIYKSNKDVIKDPNLLTPGTKIYIP